MRINGQEVPLSGNTYVYTGMAAGFVNLSAEARDAAGLSFTTAGLLAVADPNDTTPPVVAINNQDCVDVTDRYDVLGSVSDPGGVNYQLLYREQGTTTWRRFAQNSGSEFNGVLGTFDSSLLKNGVYELVLYAEDNNGNASAGERL